MTCKVLSLHEVGCDHCAARSRSDWARLAPYASEVVNQVKVHRGLAEGDVLFREGDDNGGLYCVASGVLGLRKTHANGTDALVALAYPGETLGARSFLRNGPHRTTAVALAPAIVCLVHRRDALRLTQSAPQVHLALVERCLVAMDEAQAAIVRHAAMSNSARLCHFLKAIARRDGRWSGSSVQIRLPVSRADLAVMLGIRPETLSRILRRLKDDGVLDFKGRSVAIACIDRLDAFADLAEAV